MEITERKIKDIMIISVIGRMDAMTAPEFEQSLSNSLSKGERTFLINFSDSIISAAPV